MAELKAKKKIVKIGNGDMIIANKIVQLLNLRFCSNLEIEFVDERNTTSIRWLTHLGFVLIKRIEDYGVGKKPFYEFVRIQ